MKKVLTYGTFDCLHQGHINLLSRARLLGDYLIVGVTSDEYDRYRGKRDVRESLADRITGVQNTGLADEIIIEEYEGQKISDIKKNNIDVFTVGSDWDGKFDYLKEYCEVVYLPRTEGISSTQIRDREMNKYKMGFIGYMNPMRKYINEANSVSSVQINGLYADNHDEARIIGDAYSIRTYNNIDELLSGSDLVYISERIDRNYDIVKKCIANDVHVICKGPIFKEYRKAEECFNFAAERGIVIYNSVKTKCFPSYIHLLLLVKSGKLGEIKDIDVSVSENNPGINYLNKNKYEGSLFDLAGYVFLPIFQFLGTDYEDIKIYTNKEKGFDRFTKGIIKYPGAIASFKTGKGVKTEGELVITGTKGYLHVPAPWWKTDYFEIRYENTNDNKKYFWDYEGEGFRYEIKEVIFRIENKHFVDDHRNSLAISRILEMVDNDKLSFF